MKTGLLSGILVLWAGFLFAQNEEDALRATQSDLTGTSRFIGMGGAMGALGGDASVMSTNPAGFGIYRKSEVTLTPGYYINTSSTDFYGNETQTQNNNLALSNFTFVINDQRDQNSGVISTTWGFGYNRTGNYFGRTLHRNPHPQSTLLDPWQDRLDAAGSAFENGFGYDITPAYNAYLLDYIDEDTRTYHANELLEGSQEKEIVKTGSSDEYTFSYAANFNNRFYLGGSVLLNTYRYEENSTYSEDDFPEKPEFTDLREWEFNEELDISGRAVNLKIGGIYRINDFVRLGAAYHLPSTTMIEDRYQTDAQAVYQVRERDAELEEYSGFSPGSNIAYGIRRPGKAIASAGFILGKKGLIGIEYEYSDFSNIEYRDREGRIDFEDVNDFMSNYFRAVHNIRAGAELRFDNIFARGGFRFDQSPYSSELEDISDNIYTYSLGFGYREAKFFVDIAWRIRIHDERLEWIYNPAYVSPSSVNRNAQAVMVTGGFRW